MILTPLKLNCILPNAQRLKANQKDLGIAHNVSILHVFAFITDEELYLIEMSHEFIVGISLYKPIEEKRYSHPYQKEYKSERIHWLSYFIPPI